MNSLQRLLTYSAFLLSLTFACQSEPSAGTRTHWLEECDTDADCSMDSSCICEVCTRPCASDEECEGGTCSSLATTTGICGSAEEGRICLPDDAVRECAEPLAHDFNLGGASGCEPLDALACEDFEGALSESYQVGFDGAELELQGCLAAGGQGALSFSGSADAGFAHLQMNFTEEVGQGPLYLRLRAYVPSNQVLPALGRIAAFRAVQEYTEEQVSFHVAPERKIRVSAQGVHEDSEADAFPLDEWFCLQAEVEVGAPGSTSILIDGTEVLAVPELNTLPTAGPLSNLVLFGSVFEPSPEFEMVLDDVVVSMAPVGCD